MEGINTPVNEILESKESIQEEQSKTKPRKKVGYLIIILVLIIVSLVVLLCYLFFTNRIDTSVIDEQTEEETLQEEVTEGTEEAEDEETDSEIITEKKEYYNNIYGVKFEYPLNWKIESKVDEVGNFNIFFSEDKVDPDFIFTYNLPVGSGPEICYFSDTENPEEIVFGTLFDNFETIDEKDTLRRTHQNYGDTEVYKICKKDSNLFSDWVDAGYIFYKVKIGSSNAKQMIELMDQITLSFEYTGQIGRE